MEFVNLPSIFSNDSALLPAQIWEHYSDWPSVHPVKSIFNELIQAVVDAKGEGIGASHSTPTSQELEALEQGARRLVSAGVQDGWGQAHRDKWTHSRLADWNEDPFFKICSTVMGLKRGAPERELIERDYLMKQFLSMHANAWSDSAKAILYAAAQAASHEVSRTCQGRSEVETSAKLTERIGANIHRIIDAVNASATPLPSGVFLDFGSASMQGWRDWQGADFAIVVGTTVLGRPMYRVALFQAKWEIARGKTNVSHGDGGQLDEIHSTGMGYYVSYPNTFHGRAFFTTVRPVPDVFRSVWESEDPPSFDIDTCHDRGQAAWDFAAFLAIAMTSQDDLSCGRLFPNAQAVSDVLSLGRDKPLVPHVLAMDMTGALNVHEMVQRLKFKGFDKVTSASALSILDAVGPRTDGPQQDRPGRPIK
ncbi:hypothetical protein B5K03_09510 [Rhizobium phaseoli]|nr:hypothetical protein B5K03_09510 [Rhizobium phaseoli]